MRYIVIIAIAAFILSCKSSVDAPQNAQQNTETHNLGIWKGSCWLYNWDWDSTRSHLPVKGYHILIFSFDTSGGYVQDGLTKFISLTGSIVDSSSIAESDKLPSLKMVGRLTGPFTADSVWQIVANAYYWNGISTGITMTNIKSAPIAGDSLSFDGKEISGSDYGINGELYLQ